MTRGQSAQCAAKAHLLPGDIVIGGMRIEQGILDIARLELWGHLAFQRDDGISVDHRPLAMADELEVDRIVGWELAGDVEDHPRKPWRLLDRRAGRAALKQPSYRR